MEVVYYAQHALSDGAQSLTPEQFDQVAKHVNAAAKAFGRKVG